MVFSSAQEGTRSRRHRLFYGIAGSGVTPAILTTSGLINGTTFKAVQRFPERDSQYRWQESMLFGSSAWK